LRFVGKREGQTLNARYRGKDYATNVLAFLYDASARIEGDIVLCAPVVREEARAQGKTLADHCAHLVVHGMLHLQGTITTPSAPRASWRRARPDPRGPPESPIPYASNG
jgi:probable rRNA maturation factor